MSPTAYPKNGKQRYNIAGREPFSLPENDIELPAPPESPTQPSNVSLLTLILPPVIMIIGSVISGLVSGRVNFALMLPMMLMGLGYPAANLINSKVQKKKYAEAMKARQENYIKRLREYRSMIEGMIERQQSTMHEEFPNVQQVLGIGLAAGENKRLWWRRPKDPDYLTLRLGTGRSKLSFNILPPRMLNDKDPLSELPFELMEHYEGLDNMPFLVDLRQLGSLALIGGSFQKLIRLARRLLLDVIVHHSPEDVNLFLLANRPNAAEEWEWLKWVPHTHMLDGDQSQQTLLFTTDKINSFLDELNRLFLERLEQQNSHGGNQNYHFNPSYLVVMDDDRVRQHLDIQRIADEGYRVGIHLVFIGGAYLPSTCRARIEIDSAGNLDYLETFQAVGSGNHRKGVAELVQKKEIEPLARTLAGLEVVGGKSATILPSMVRVVDLIEGDPYSVSDVVDHWRAAEDDSKQVLLPVGQYVDRDGLAIYEIDFRPESLGGLGAYHAMMIGTTGSGKSIFMQSLVLAAAHRYSPRQINFMFMDFKAGAAELKKVSELPHSVGMVTDLSPELAERALQALENELFRRKTTFENAGKITDIWDFNRRFPDQAFPHLIVMIDEFAAGIKILPTLVARLEELGRQGRAYGMYFFLANQEVNSAVDSLKANASWYILLKVNRPEEMRLIGGRLPVPPGRGRGYIKVKEDITSIQSAYAGLPADVGDQSQAEINEYAISTFGPGGDRNEIYRFDPRRANAENSPVRTELEMLMAVITEAAYTLHIPHADPIYTEPLPPLVPLSEVIACQDLYHRFDGSSWQRCTGERNVVPLGFVDIPKRCQQQAFSVNFNEAGGHLWVIGSPGSGKSMVLLSLASVLCLTHTPAEINLYGLEFGTGSLSMLNAFPHTAAVIRAHEAERIDRLLRFLQEELRQRTERDWHLEGRPEIYLLVNNIADLRQQYPDQSEDLGRFIRSGGAVGIHVIIASNRGSELPRSLSGNIINRIVLQLPEKQDFMDVLNMSVPPLTMRTQGRGFWASEGVVSECQIALVDEGVLSSSPLEENQIPQEAERDETAKNNALGRLPSTILKLGQQMRQSWTGKQPQGIHAMKDVLEMGDFDREVEKAPHELSGAALPIGLIYDNLDPLIVDLNREGPFWSLIGPRQSGKTTGLITLAHYLRQSLPANSRVTFMPMRKDLISRIKSDDPQVQVILQPDAMIEGVQTFLDTVQSQSDVFHCLMFDDLGVAFSGGNTPLVQALNALGDQLALATQENFLIVIADLYSSFKSTQAYSSSFLKLFQQSQTGILFSLEDTDMQWFNARVNLMYKKTLKWMTGRGFYVSKGNPTYIQCPLITPDVFEDHQAQD